MAILELRAARGWNAAEKRRADRVVELEAAA